MPYTTYLNEKLNQHAFGSVDYTPEGTIYVGLSTSAPSQDGTNVTEPSTGSYARVAVTNNNTNWVATSPQPGTGAQQQENGTTISFPTATGSWGTVTHFVLYDAATVGNLLAFGTLDSSKTVASGDDSSFAAGALKISLD